MKLQEELGIISDYWRRRQRTKVQNSSIWWKRRHSNQERLSGN